MRGVATKPITPAIGGVVMSQCNVQDHFLASHVLADFGGIGDSIQLDVNMDANKS
jgi:hypothetical protein